MKQVTLKIDEIRIGHQLPETYMRTLAKELNFLLVSSGVSPYGDHLVVVEFEGEMPKWPDTLEVASTIRTKDPIAPSRAMPDNYDPEQMARVLIRDKELARTCAPDVVQRLAQELLNALSELAALREKIDSLHDPRDYDGR